MIAYKKFLKRILPWAGIALVITGVVHCVLGFVLLPDIANEIIRRGIVGAVEGDINNPHFGFLWYQVSGLAMIAMGLLIDWLLRRQKLRLPMAFCTAFLAMGLFLILLFPQGGAWILFAESVILFGGTWLQGRRT